MTDIIWMVKKGSEKAGVKSAINMAMATGSVGWRDNFGDRFIEVMRHDFIPDDELDQWELYSK